MIQRTDSTRHNFCSSAVGCDLAAATLQELEDENHLLRNELDHQRNTNGNLTCHIKRLELELNELRYSNQRLSQHLDRRSTRCEETGRVSENRVARQFQQRVKDLMKTLDEKDRAHDKSSNVLVVQMDDLKNQLAKLRTSEHRRAHQLEQAQVLIRTTQDEHSNMAARYEELCGMLDIERCSAEQLRLKVQNLEDELEADRMHIRLTPLERSVGFRGVPAPGDESPMTHMRSDVEVAAQSDVHRHSAGLKRMGTDDLARALGEDKLMVMRRECGDCAVLREELFETKSRLLQDCTDLRVRLEASEAALANTDLNHWGQQALSRNLSTATTDIGESSITSWVTARSSLQLSTDDVNDEQRQHGLTPVAETTQSGVLRNKEPTEKVKVGDVVAEFLEEDGSLKIEIKDAAYSSSFSGGTPDTNRKQAMNAMVQRIMADLTDSLDQGSAFEEKKLLEGKVSDDPLRLQDFPCRPENAQSALTEPEKEQLQRHGQSVLTEPEEELSPPPEHIRPQAQQDVKAECDCLREERDKLKTILASAQQLGQEQERSLQQLRSSNMILERLLASSSQHTPTADPAATNKAQLASNAAQSAGFANSSLATLASEQAELAMQNRALQEKVHCLREQLASQAKAVGSHGSGKSEDLISVPLEACEARARCHVAQLAELEARRKADALPGLAAENLHLRRRAAEAEHKLGEMNEAAGGATWLLNKSTFWGGFMSAAPDTKTAVRPLPIGANNMPAGAVGGGNLFQGFR